MMEVFEMKIKKNIFNLSRKTNLFRTMNIFDKRVKVTKTNKVNKVHKVHKIEYKSIMDKLALKLRGIKIKNRLNAFICNNFIDTNTYNIVIFNKFFKWSN